MTTNMQLVSLKNIVGMSFLAHYKCKMFLFIKGVPDFMEQWTNGKSKKTR